VPPYRYRVSGLTLQSDRPIDGLGESADRGTADVRVWFGAHRAAGWRTSGAPPKYVSPVGDGLGRPVAQAWDLQDGAGLGVRIADGTEIVVDASGTELWIDAPPESSGLTSEYVLGAGLSLILSQRGIVCLHASAVEVDGLAAVFVGPHGAGKSTVAAALVMAGARPLADDLAALVPGPDDHAPGVWAGVRAIRARSGAVEEVARQLGRQGDLTSTSDGRYFDVRGDAAGGRDRPAGTQLGALYHVGAREAAAPGPMRIESMTGAEGLVLLARHTWMGRLLNRTGRAIEFAMLARLINHVPMMRIAGGDASTLIDLAGRVADALRRPSARRGRVPLSVP
jgi:hypothetical protein